MHTKRMLWLAVVVGLCAVVSACGTSNESGAIDSGLTECDDGRTGEDCDGTQLPGDDGSVDEEAPDSGSDRDGASEEGERDAMQVDEPDAEVEQADAAVDEEVDAS